ncbi:MAG TPA: ATP-binding protein [Lentimicrobium sp.]|nr:ATP-binding protein [Lentimicrobium sp.]
MKFNTSNASGLARNNAIMIAAFSVLVILVISLASHLYIPVWAYIVFALLLFAFSYFSIQYSVTKFISEKIRIIYKTIRTSKLPKGTDNVFTKSSIESVNREVLEWSENKRKEIEELKKMERYRREFLGNVSHELKTPIFNIQGYILTLLDGGLEDPSINMLYLQKTEKSINRMIALVEDLEKISQLESGELQMNFIKFDVVNLCREVIDFLEMKSKKKKATIYFAQPYEKPIMVIGDKERIKEVLINLIDNSIKYGKAKDTRIKISFFDMDNSILIEIADNGQGIENEELPRIFERFYRIDKARSREKGGSGLGLAIVKHIIEAHEETINVRSTLGVGTTFGFTLRKA